MRRVPSWNDPLDDDGRLARLRFRLGLAGLTAAVVVLTAWLCSLGPVPAVLGLLGAKHVLVSVLLVKQDVEAAERAGPGGEFLRPVDDGR